MNLSNRRITDYRLAGLVLSVVLVILSLYGLTTKGLNLGIDFSGGLITEFSTSQPVEQSVIEDLLIDHVGDKFRLTSAQNETVWTLRQADDGNGLSVQQWSDILVEGFFSQEKGIRVELLGIDYIGSQVGQELINQGGLAMIFSMIVIVIYLSMRFEWRFAVGALLALIHDVIVVLGIFSWLKLTFDLTVLASLLAVIGYSLNDSIIVADRIRELLKSKGPLSISSTIDAAVKSTLVRTLITSGTTLMTILAIWLFAGSSLQSFSVALFSGVLVGTISSISISATTPQLTGMDANYHRDREEVKDIM